MAHEEYNEITKFKIIVRLWAASLAVLEEVCLVAEDWLEELRARRRKPVTNDHPPPADPGPTITSRSPTFGMRADPHLKRVVQLTEDLQVPQRPSNGGTIYDARRLFRRPDPPPPDRPSGVSDPWRPPGGGSPPPSPPTAPGGDGPPTITPLTRSASDQFFGRVTRRVSPPPSTQARTTGTTIPITTAPARTMPAAEASRAPLRREEPATAPPRITPARSIGDQFFGAGGDPSRSTARPTITDPPAPTPKTPLALPPPRTPVAPEAPPAPDRRWKPQS